MKKNIYKPIGERIADKIIEQIVFGVLYLAREGKKYWNKNKKNFKHISQTILSRRFSKKTIALLLMVGLNGAGLVSIRDTFSFYSDTEDSSGNIFEATGLDFYLSNSEENEFLGVEVYGNLQFATVPILEVDSLDIQYTIHTEKISGDDDFCGNVFLIVKENGMPFYTGPILDFSSATTTTLGTWEFELDALPQPGNFAHGDQCNIDFVFDGWRTDVPSPELSGFTDEERFTMNITSRMIVLNEYLPNPVGNECSIDGEWVELYNNGNEEIDLVGWEVQDSIGSVTTIDTTTTMGGSTIIGAKGSGTEWIVVNLDGCVLNNTGDTINLYDENTALVDTRTYSTSSENKSDARIPDGIGAWIDPFPTPGGPNKLLDDTEELQNIQVINEEETDTEAPVIDIIGNNPAYIAIDSDYNDLGAIVTDNVNDGLGFVVEGEVDTTIEGVYEITYTAKDQVGNIGTITRFVVVGNPEIEVGQIPTEEIIVEEGSLTPATTGTVVEQIIPEPVTTTTPEVIVEEKIPETILTSAEPVEETAVEEVIELEPVLLEKVEEEVVEEINHKVTVEEETNPGPVIMEEFKEEEEVEEVIEETSVILPDEATTVVEEIAEEIYVE